MDPPSAAFQFTICQPVEHVRAGIKALPLGSNRERICTRTRGRPVIGKRLGFTPDQISKFICREVGRCRQLRFKSRSNLLPLRLPDRRGIRPDLAT